MTLSIIGQALEIAVSAGNALKGATAATTAIRDMIRKPDPDLTAIKERLAGLIDQLVDAKEAQMTMQQTLLDLQSEQQHRDRFAQEAARYQLAKTDMGGVVRTLKSGDQSGEPAHEICASCFERGKKSILQRVDFNTLGCSQCGERVHKSDGTGRAVTARLQTRWDVLDPYRDD